MEILDILMRPHQKVWQTVRVLVTLQSVLCDCHRAPYSQLYLPAWPSGLGASLSSNCALFILVFLVTNTTPSKLLLDYSVAGQSEWNLKNSCEIEEKTLKVGSENPIRSLCQPHSVCRTWAVLVVQKYLLHLHPPPASRLRHCVWVPWKCLHVC